VVLDQEKNPPKNKKKQENPEKNQEKQENTKNYENIKIPIIYIMREITIAQFEKLPKKGPIAGRSLEAGKLYYIRDIRNKTNPVYVGKYVKPVMYYNDNSVLYNYRFEEVKYLANPSKYRREPGEIFGNVEKYYEVVDPTPTKTDIKNKKITMKELEDFIRGKKAEPHESTPNVSFFGKDYRKVRDKFNNRSKQRSSLSSSRSSRKHVSRSSSRNSRSTRSSSRRSSLSSQRSLSSRSSHRLNDDL
jgi:hypothetical protein